MLGTGVGTLEEVRKWKTNENETVKKLVPDFFAARLEELLPHINRNM